MKKTIRILSAGIAVLLLSAAACFASFADEPLLDEEQLTQGINSYILQVSGLSDEELLNYIAYYQSVGDTATSDTLISYVTLSQEMGEFLSVGETEYDYSETGFIHITTPVIFENGRLNYVIHMSSDFKSGEQYFEIPAAGQDSLGAKMKEAGVNLVVGMGTVFAVLIFLCWVISLFGKVNVLEKKIASRKNTAEKKSKKETAEEKQPEIIEFKADETDENELRAVIAAAIAAYESDSGSSIKKQPALTNGIIIKSYRRK